MKQTKREAELTDCLLTMVGLLIDRMAQIDALKAERRELRTSRDAVRADLERVLREEVETTP